MKSVMKMPRWCVWILLEDDTDALIEEKEDTKEDETPEKVPSPPSNEKMFDFEDDFELSLNKPTKKQCTNPLISKRIY